MRQALWLTFLLYTLNIASGATQPGASDTVADNKSTRAQYDEIGEQLRLLQNKEGKYARMSEKELRDKEVELSTKQDKLWTEMQNKNGKTFFTPVVIGIGIGLIVIVIIMNIFFVCRLRNRNRSLANSQRDIEHGRLRSPHLSPPQRHSPGRRSPRSRSRTPSDSEAPPRPPLPKPRATKIQTKFHKLALENGRAVKAFRIGKVLGEGGFGKVRMVQKRIDGMKYALKGCALERDETLVELHLREVQTMSKMTSSKVVRYYDSWIEEMTDDVAEGFFGNELKRVEMKKTKSDGRTLVLFMQLELCDIDLKNWQKEKRSLDEKWDIVQQIVEGLHFIHSRGLVHRDMKPANVLLNIDKRGRAHAKIADLGLAKFRRNRALRSREVSAFTNYDATQHGGPKNNMTKMVGTMLYGAPEQMTSRDYNFKVDMYALGIIMFELFSGFKSRSERHQAVLKLRKKRKCYFREAPEGANLIIQLLHKDPRMRPSALDILHSENLPFGQPSDLTPAQAAYMEREILKVSLGTNSRSAGATL